MPQTPLWKLRPTYVPPDPLAGFEGHTSKGREGKEGKGSGCGVRGLEERS